MKSTFSDSVFKENLNNLNQPKRATKQHSKSGLTNKFDSL